MAGEAELEVATPIGPFRGENAVHHDIARATVAADAEVANHAVLLGAEGFDRALRAEIEIIGPEADDLAAERVEGVAEEEQLAGGVDVGALATLPVPRVADFHALDRRRDVVISCRSDNRTGRQIAYDPRQHVTVALAFERICHVRAHAVGWRDRDEPELPEAPVARRRGQRVTVLAGQRLEPNAVTFEHDRLWSDHAGEATPPGFMARRNPVPRRSATVPRASPTCP